MIENLIQNLIAISLGMMIFFSFIVAPVIFKVLNVKDAGKFVRKIFPYYYLINLLFTLIVVGLFFYISSIDLNFYITLMILFLFLFLLFILMPLINKFKDNNEKKKFAYSHGLSVIINLIQIIGLIYLIV
tara:strand:- start:97 stop:486 length:390 start_codon:yes stop_codon:yes gene_type:complete